MMSNMDTSFCLFNCIVFIFITASTCQSIKSISGGEEGEDFSTAEAVHGLSGSNISLKCEGEGTSVSWKKGKHNITSEDLHRSIETQLAGDVAALPSEAEAEESMDSTAAPSLASTISILHIKNITLMDSGRYHCFYHSENGESAEESIQLIVKSAPVLLSAEDGMGAVGATIGISCTFQSHPPPEIEWIKGNSSLQSNERLMITSSNEGNLFLSKLEVIAAELADNGTYMCLAKNSAGKGTESGTPHLLVHAVPEILWTIARSLGPEDIQLEWQVVDNEEDIKDIEIWISDDGSEQTAERWKSLPSTARSAVLGDGFVDAVKGGGQTISVWLRVNTLTGLKVVSQPRNVTMLLKVPEYIPKASFRGSTLNSLTVNWMSPSSEEAQYVSYYLLTLTDMRSGATQQVQQSLGTKEHSFTNLNAGTQYNFTMTACMGVYEVAARDCGPPSPAISGSTLFDPPASVEEVLVTCSHSDYGGWSVDVSWKPASGATETGSVDHYKLEFTSMANYVDEEGQRRYEDDRREENVSVNFTSYKFIGASANTNYTVKVYAGIKHMYSKGMTAQCRMPVWLPRQYSLKWWKTSPSLHENVQDTTTPGDEPKAALLKLPVPSISQRNGTICCYRVAVVKLGDGVDLSALGPPENLPLLTHRLSHESLLTAAYVAEAYTRTNDRYLVLGDNKTVGGNWSEGCGACMKYSAPPSPSTTARPSTVPTTTLLEALSTSSDPTSTATLPASLLSEAPPPHGLVRRSPNTDLLPPVVDGALSPAHNYSGFLILSVNSGKGGVLHRYSEYFNVVNPVMSEAPPSTATSSNSATDLTKQPYLLVALCVLAVLIIITLVLCAVLIFYKRRNKHLEDELVYSDTTLGRKLFRSLRKSNTLLSQNSIEVKPIAKDDLVMVYLENIKDSELGFRREYEALPEKLVDRSTRVSEMLENCSKNRYPDIKAYDQTRVKLNVSAAHPSDYINANFVLGYKERKKFICAQGPMDATVDDFWRMIVEQGCGICVMLTNLEENGKVKCVKYWPEAGQPKTFGNITVRLVKEKSYADYIVRTLRAEWMVQSVSSNVDLSNKNVVGGEGSTSTNTSNASNTNHSSSGSLAEELKYHEVEQYHYLMWKDFVAPEHPVGILAFLRRMNEAYSHEKGPLLVHCSAGVGRTGTLVALDSLVQELDDERQASVYNLICDLRHQRNFLVQSLKQYVFIHRALMEYAQFGSTEQTPLQLREAYIKHVNQVQQQHASPVLFEEFDLLSKVIEERKAFTIATSEENKCRNRYDYVLPYDSNRVILSPVAGKPVNTYINASFVSGFDLDEHFIVTQDPMENTVADFWRMIFEQDVTTIVMLSELGSGDHLCTRYWPEEDEDAQHDNITVKLLSSESYPKFSSRVFQLSHSKNGDSRQITQFQYVGWSGLMGEVPVGTYGIMELINRVHSHVQASLSTSMPTPVVVHCSGGGDRCSVYVCLNNCLRQLRREARVDVFQIARKIRSMRQFMLQEPTQYEFCYKALIEYIDSKGLDNI